MPIAPHLKMSLLSSGSNSRALEAVAEKALPIPRYKTEIRKLLKGTEEKSPALTRGHLISSMIQIENRKKIDY